MEPPVPRLVVDASVILKWVLDEEPASAQEAARDLLTRWGRGELHLLAPSLWRYEVGNTLVRKAPERAAEFLVTLVSLGFAEFHLSNRLAAETAALAQRTGLTFYDSAYAALAEQEHAELVTADARMAQRLPPGAVVRLLG